MCFCKRTGKVKKSEIRAEVNIFSVFLNGDRVYNKYKSAFHYMNQEGTVYEEKWQSGIRYPDRVYRRRLKRLGMDIYDGSRAGAGAVGDDPSV